MYTIKFFCITSKDKQPTVNNVHKNALKLSSLRINSSKIERISSITLSKASPIDSRASPLSAPHLTSSFTFVLSKSAHDSSYFTFSRISYTYARVYNERREMSNSIHSSGYPLPSPRISCCCFPVGKLIRLSERVILFTGRQGSDERGEGGGGGVGKG